VDENNNQLFAYTRTLDNEQFLIVLNFSDTPAQLKTTIQINKDYILISNYEKPCINDNYEPYAAVIYKTRS
jgi:glycosidase